jgi:hypothetical protein
VSVLRRSIVVRSLNQPPLQRADLALESVDRLGLRADRRAQPGRGCCPAWYRLVKSAELVATPAASTVPASRRKEAVRRIADMRMNS